MTRRRREPPLSSEDLALWEHVARSVTPSPGCRRVGPRSDVELPSVQFEPRPPQLPPATPASRSPAASPPVSPSRPKRLDPELSTFDRKTAKRLKGGRTTIDSRIDLHGLRQAEAHDVLRHFIQSAAARGDRLVLVITGKGRGDGEGRGVLSLNVPRWLAEPDLRRHVVSFTVAGPRHGGDGALYVHIRDPRRNSALHNG